MNFVNFLGELYKDINSDAVMQMCHEKVLPGLHAYLACCFYNHRITTITGTV